MASLLFVYGVVRLLGCTSGVRQLTVNFYDAFPKSLHENIIER